MRKRKVQWKSGLATRDSYEDPSYYSVACFGQLLTFVTFPTDCWETRPPWTEFFSTLLFCQFRRTPDIEKQLKSFNAHKKLSHWISCKSFKLIVVRRRFVQDKYLKKSNNALHKGPWGKKNICMCALLIRVSLSVFPSFCCTFYTKMFIFSPLFVTRFTRQCLYLVPKTLCVIHLPVVYGKAIYMSECELIIHPPIWMASKAIYMLHWHVNCMQGVEKLKSEWYQSCRAKKTMKSEWYQSCLAIWNGPFPFYIPSHWQYWKSPSLIGKIYLKINLKIWWKYIGKYVRKYIKKYGEICMKIYKKYGEIWNLNIGCLVISFYEFKTVHIENLLPLFWKYMEISDKTYNRGTYMKSEWYRSCLGYGSETVSNIENLF